jgi:hypothetical protein
MIKKILFSLILNVIFFVCNYGQQVPQFNWAKKTGGTSSDNPRSVTTDFQGNIYITGSFNGTVDFDAGVGVFNLTSSGSSDIFILKLNSFGNFLNAWKIGGNGPDLGYTIILDQIGNIYTCGYFSDTVDFDIGQGVYKLISYGINDAFAAKMDSNGNLLWALQFGDTSSDYGYNICLDASNNVLFTGYYSGGGKFSPNITLPPIVSNGIEDIFVAKIDHLGNVLLAKNIGGDSTDIAISVACDKFNNVYLTGAIYDSVDFVTSNNGTYSLVSNGAQDIFVAKFDSLLNFNWAKQIGGNGFDQGREIEIDSTGSIYLTGKIDSVVSILTVDSLVTIYALGKGDPFFCKLDSSGNFLWVKSFGSSNSDFLLGSDIDKQGNIYLTGNIFGIVDFDPSSSFYNLTANYGDNPFIAKYDKDGNFIWAGLFSSNSNLSFGFGRDLKVMNDSIIYTVGTIFGTLDLDPTNTIFNQTSSGSTDIFISKIIFGNLPNSLEFLHTSKSILLYPNPNNGQFTIQSKTKGDFAILNELGQTLQTFQTNGENNYSANLKGLANGIYFLKGKNGEQVVNEKIVVAND